MRMVEGRLEIGRQMTLGLTVPVSDTGELVLPEPPASGEPVTREYLATLTETPEIGPRVVKVERSSLAQGDSLYHATYSSKEEQILEIRGVSAAELRVIALLLYRLTEQMERVPKVTTVLLTEAELNAPIAPNAAPAGEAATRQPAKRVRSAQAHRGRRAE